MTCEGAVDRPLAGAIIYQHTFEVSGWAASGRSGIWWRRIHARIGDEIVGTTMIRYERPDVARSHGLSHFDVGFAVRCSLPEALRGEPSIKIVCDVEFEDGSTAEIPGPQVDVSRIDYRLQDYGGILVDGFDAVLSRSQVYTTGAPAARADDYCAQLVRRYLKPGDRVLDVGCGVGAWRDTLVPFGIDWFGVEARPDFVEQMKAAGMAAALVGDTLPFSPALFDATICIEVLEHVVDPAPFLAEVARVSSRIGIFSVPNFGAVPLTAARYAVPWHMLEGDHKWFFTAHSLASLLKPYYSHVETIEYGELEWLPSIDGIPVHNHILAIGLH